MVGRDFVGLSWRERHEDQLYEMWKRQRVPRVRGRLIRTDQRATAGCDRRVVPILGPHRSLSPGFSRWKFKDRLALTCLWPHFVPEEGSRRTV